jgi:type IV pilus assembly protein PilB
MGKSRDLGVPSVDLSDFAIDRALIDLVPSTLAERHNILPIKRAGSTLVICMSDPTNMFVVDDVKVRTGLNVEVTKASQRDIERAIKRYYYAN